jgi:acylphosphatase
MSEESGLRVHLFIGGKVQGVGFRANACMIARHIGVQGWIKNLADGRVEAVAEGAEGAVKKFAQWCHLGPQYAEVTEVEILWEEPTGQEQGFREQG